MRCLALAAVALWLAPVVALGQGADPAGDESDSGLQLIAPDPLAPPPPRERAVDEMVVTAQKRVENIQDVPISITALDAEFLENSGTTNLLEVGQFLPNVSLNQVTDSRSSAIRIRGIGNDGVNAGIDPAVGVFLDGIYQGRTGLTSSLDLADIERMEVLRGPQGTLYGKNTAAGAINVVTKKPVLNEWDAFLEGTVGNFFAREVRGTINVPLMEDRIATRLTGYWVQRDGFDKNFFNGDRRNDADRNGVRLRTLFNITDDLELLVWGDYSTEQNTCCVADIVTYSGPPALDVRFRDLAASTGRPLPRLDTFDRRVDANEQSTNDIQLLGGAAELNYDTIGDHVLTLLGGYRRFEARSLLDGDFSGYDAVIQDIDEVFQQYSAELRLTSPPSDTFEYVAGLYFYYHEYDLVRQTGIGPEWLDVSGLGPAIRSQGGADANGDVNNFSTNLYETFSYAFFGQGTYSILENLKLTVGLRGTYEVKTRQGSQVAGFTLIDQGVFGPDRNLDEELNVANFSPMGVLQYFPTDDSMVFVRFARGFKSGGFNELRTVGAVQTQFDDEEATDLEAGFRTTWLDQMVTLNTTFFHTWYDEFQAQTFDGVTPSITNAGSLRSYGVEGDLLVVPHESIQLGLGVGWNPTVFEEFPNATCTSRQIARVGPTASRISPAARSTMPPSGA